jgi:hypothetical protein
MTQRQKTMTITVAIIVFVAMAAGAWIWMLDATIMEIDTKRSRAMMDVSNWNKAVMIFKEKHKRFAVTLEELTNKQPDGTMALMDTSALVDPWNNPYNYDLNRLDPKKGMPLIWSNGGPGRNKPIRNWDQ